MATLKTVAGIWNTNEGQNFVQGCERACNARQAFAATQGGPAVNATAKASFKAPTA